MSYTIHIQQPFLWWKRTKKVQADNTEQAARILSEHIQAEVNPVDLYGYVDKVFIIGGRKTITLHQR